MKEIVNDIWNAPKAEVEAAATNFMIGCMIGALIGLAVVIAAFIHFNKKWKRRNDEFDKNFKKFGKF